jgi:SAM-dependent methyltransferase
MPEKLEPGGPNAEQIRYWNEMAGPKWVAFKKMIDLQIRGLGLATMEHAAVAAGERVLDVGCGCGDTTLELASRVGATGRVLGVDISRVMLDRARELAAQAGFSNVELASVDAQTYALPRAAFDLVYSRFGVMFFTDPPAAFANLRRSLRPGGRLAFVCWRTLGENPWMAVPLMAAMQYLTVTPPPPDAPGPFSFADAQRIRDILSRAGFSAVEITPIDETFTVGGGGDLDATVEFVLQMGPTGAALRESEEDVREAVARVVREALVPYHGDAGVKMSSGAWIVTARQGDHA